MATNKHASIRYLALDKCFNNPGKKYFIDDLLEVCEAAIYEYTGKNEALSRRTFYNDLEFMKSEQGWSAPIEKHTENRKAYFRYADTSFSIRNQPLNESEANQLKEVFITLNKFKGMPQFEWIEEMTTRLDATFKLSNIESHIIDFEYNPYLKGIDYITPLYNAIIYKKAIAITYQGFKQDQANTYVYHPYYLKQYNNRWFLFALNDEKEKLSNLALDRIINIADTNIPYVENTTIDFETYFEDVVGVTINGASQKLVIKISNDLYPYIKSKPIHSSQKERKKLSKQYIDSTIIELDVIINYELKSLLFSYGEKLIILEPTSLAKELKDKANQIISNYN